MDEPVHCQLPTPGITLEYPVSTALLIAAMWTVQFQNIIIQIIIKLGLGLFLQAVPSQISNVVNGVEKVNELHLPTIY